MCEECEERDGGPGLLKRHTLWILDLTKVCLCYAFNRSLQTVNGSSAGRIINTLNKCESAFICLS